MEKREGDHREYQRAETESNNISLSGDIAYTVNYNISVKLLSNARINDGSFLGFQNAYNEPQEIIDNIETQGRVVSKALKELKKLMA
jgi:hypothetical protein